MMMIIEKLFRLKNKMITNKHIKGVFNDYARKPNNGKNILIYAGIGHMYISYFENLLYHLLIKEGYNVDFLVYDEKILINERITKKVIDNQGKDKFWNKNIKNSHNLLKISNVSFEAINAERKEVIDQVEKAGTDLDAVFAYSIDGVELGTTVKNTM